MRKCEHGIDVGPLDDYGVPDDVAVSPYSAYCAFCNPQRADADGPGGFDNYDAWVEAGRPGSRSAE